MCACTAVLDQLTCTAIHIYIRRCVCTLPGSRAERPTAMFLDVYSWKLTYSELMLCI